MQEKKNLEKFLKILDKYEKDKNNKLEVREQLEVIMNMDFNINQNLNVEYFKNTYPNFNPNVHKLLSRCAKQQKHDYRKQNRLSIRTGKFIIEYN